MNGLPDRVLDHLCQVVDWPDLSATKYEPIEKIGQGGWLPFIGHTIESWIGRWPSRC